MLLFQKSLIGAYCNRLFDLKKGMTPFYIKAELKQTALAKILMSLILIRKRDHQTAHFFDCQNDRHLGYAIIFLYISSLLPLTLSKLQIVVCVIVFSF